MPDLAQRYIRLAHAMGAHAPGHIEGDFGPSSWAVKEALLTKVLQREIDELAEAVTDERHESRRLLTERVTPSEPRSRAQGRSA
ncbi:hypothetical protein [Deinococcus peraridilitoris]|uniref:Uncharacterized protein n=1 Tax=Deinococcus peraridilitoris (strain DSM 19664 / LMG 22246 / CIP 109416 / KR-200) TaxID=937777 RepID=L0A5D8_DEIPD|nr:hypothetical protein [Deinococcus peraridilitoris]AFZ68397.1 hypothetical protein Deipe_2941 [Deinococcus peraridilitoris DSM 19664]